MLVRATSSVRIAAVGLLELVRQLAVQGHDAAVGLLQFGVEQEQLLLLPLEVFQRGDQVLVLPPQLVQGGPRRRAGRRG
jgi:hypothetical protein